MSNQTYDNLLQEVTVSLKEQLDFEKPPDASMLPKSPIEQRKFFKQYYSALYVRYLIIFSKLEQCYDQILQPQKREYIRDILESVIVRFLVIRSMLIQLGGEFVDLDDILVHLKETPDVLDIDIPAYFKEEDEKELKRRDILMNILLERHGIEDQSLKVEEPEDKLPPMSIQEAILIIQTNERGRQGRQSAKYKRDLKKREDRVRKVVEQGAYQVDRHKAAILVQKLFKGYITRKRIQQMAQDELEFLGMARKTTNNKKPGSLIERSKMTAAEKLNKTRARRKLIQAQNKNELEHERVAMRERIIKEEGPRIKEDLHDAIVEKLILFRQAQKEPGIPSFPSEEDGGSKKFMLEQESNEDHVKQLAEEKKAKKKAKADAKKKGGGTKKKKKGAEKTKKEPEGVLDPPELKYEIANNLKKYIQQWQHYEEDTNDFTQKYDPDVLRQELMSGDKGIEEELRKEVDAKIREEIENLKAQTGKAKKGKKKGKKKKGKKKKGKKGKKGKGKKKASSGDKKTEPLLSELVSQEIAQRYPNVRIADYIGEHKVLGSIQDWSEPSMGQIRETVAEVALSMGSTKIHEKAPHNKAILIFGPEKSGKTLLSRAIASELGASWFDLSPKVIEGKYESTKDTTTMIKMVFEVAKDMQPAIIYIDEIDKVFKATKKKSKTAPTRIKKELLAQVKSLKPGTRVLVVGNSRSPWDGEKKAMVSFFNRFVYTVIPDYASCQTLWKTLIERKIEEPLPQSFDIQTLSYISNGYTSGSISVVVDKVLSDRRVKRLQIRPLKIDEFIGPLSKLDPVFKKTYDKMKSFVDSLPVKYRKRTKKDEEAELEALKKAAEGGDDKKKKK